MKQIILPGTGKSMSDFVKEVGDEINAQVAATSTGTLATSPAALAAPMAPAAPGTPAPAATAPKIPKWLLAMKNGCRVCVRYGLTGKLEPREFKKYFCSMRFHAMSAEAAITDFERYVEFVTAYSVSKSINRSQAAALLASPDLKDRLYHLTRLFEFPIPIKRKNKTIGMLEEGFHVNNATPGDSGNKAYYCGHKIDMWMSFSDAKDLIDLIFSKFDWDPAHPQSKVHAIARLLTPYCQGIMGFQAKSPLWIFQANRSRAGKDYLAAIAPLVFAGTAYEDAPLDKDDSENKRRITAAIIAGHRFMHFANCKLDLDQCPSLEAAVTAKFWHDRIIGTSETIQMSNEIIYSLSYNGPVKLSEDMVNRVRRIKLFLPPSTPANSRPFSDLHGWISSDMGRRKVIAALDAFVENWKAMGRPPGSKKFTSFPEWAAVVGGIMEAAKYDSPCEPDPEDKINMARTWHDDICILAEAIGMKQPGVPLDMADIVKDYVKTDADLDAAMKRHKSEAAYKHELGQQLKKVAGKDLGGGLKVAIDLRGGAGRPKYIFSPMKTAASTASTGTASAVGSTTSGPAPAAGAKPASSASGAKGAAKKPACLTDDEFDELFKTPPQPQEFDPFNL